MRAAVVTRPRSGSSVPICSLHCSFRPGRRSRLVCASAVMNAAQAANQNEHVIANSNAILLQGFGWESCRQGGWWNRVAQAAPDIGAEGFTHVWLPPPSQSVSQEGYLPSQLYNLNSAYGSREELVGCIHALKAAGVKPVADCVFNHRCADMQDSHGKWTKYSNAYEPEGVATCAWDARAITSDDPAFNGQGSTDTGEDFHAAPDLDHTNLQVQQGLSDFARYLVEQIGFEGLRFDFTKGYSGEFTGLYARAGLQPAQLAVGEYWTPLRYDGEGRMNPDQVAHRRQVEFWIRSTGGRCMAFDFGTKGLLQEAIRFKKYNWLVDRDRRPHGLIGSMPTHAVTFIDNHDTGSSQRHWPFPRMKKMEGYAYILTHPGVPAVFWEHMYEDSDDLKEGIQALIRLRRMAGINSTSTIEVLIAEPEVYLADISGSRKAVRVKLGPKRSIGDFLPEEGGPWAKYLKGSDFCIWERDL